ncbi:aldehyde dehydrogenase [Brevirhabdus pacifica]|uniref:Aldehyde dehydrogenase n=2 Tax=Brevirhabdus pacifica TaxID=1267768 RepID=A0A1U7DMD1_9RHOB|nr:aldehyde dehydrogenase family protein [Brevirhabdus pacifica]APX91131.1 aldehyde dehydrogenase [Brevirhabdus pacifica]PJJ80780.1 acyl-CoA reductase-like NAD-dependent aldehyde dehydrogenase [Brevirhabdus pacifica]
MLKKQNYPVSTKMLIDGELVASESGAELVSTDPADESELGRVPAATAADVNRAVAAAERAQPEWARIGPVARGAYLRKLAAALRERADEVLELEVRDTGNTITKMAADVGQAADTMDYFAGLATELKGETIPASSEHLHLTLREPYGVVGRIVPFNHPIKFAAHAISAPLIAGNTVVVKPPEQSPLSAALLGELCRDILPAGCVNILTGNGMPTGDAIVRHPSIKRIAFTGSVPTGRAIQMAAAESGVKNVTLELGGKNPLIAFPDMDPAKIAEVGLAGMNFSWQGQSCGSTSRLLLHEDIHDEVVERLLEAVARIRVGHPLDPASQMGPLNSRRHYERVQSMIAKGNEEGARLRFGGQRPPGKEFERGYWLQPTVFSDVEAGMTLAREEIFGPVLSIFKWRTEEEAFDLANSTEYGLTASIWTNDIKTAMRAVRRVKSGYIWVNGASGHFYGTPFGGMKSSGIGREEGLGELLSYTETKTVHFMGAFA